MFPWLNWGNSHGVRRIKTHRPTGDEFQSHPFTRHSNTNGHSAIQMPRLEVPTTCKGCVMQIHPPNPPTLQIWLVVWNMNFMFPYIGNNHPS